MTDARAGKYRLLNSVKNVSLSSDIETHMCVIERRSLQSLLLEKFEELGGELRWGKKVEKIEDDEDRTRIKFHDGDSVTVDLVVGADGAWSEVRRHILRTRNEKTAAQRWVPEFLNTCGFYGISTTDARNVDPEILWDTHGVWLDRGNLSTSPLLDGKIR